jgi:diphthine-ammonia ligase
MRTQWSFFASWSGGKDSCLAVYRTIRAGHACTSLFSMIDESGTHSRSHGLPPGALAAQANAMGVPILMARASWEDYEEQFKKGSEALKARGAVHGVFGDIDLEPHREWVERVCAESGLVAHQPLWHGARKELVGEFIAAGFRAVIVVVDALRMPDSFLGREIDGGLVSELEAIGVDACGENGEFHTFVFDGPLFKHRVDFTTDAVFHIGNHAVLPVIVGGTTETAA